MTSSPKPPGQPDQLDEVAASDRESPRIPDPSELVTARHGIERPQRPVPGDILPDVSSAPSGSILSRISPAPDVPAQVDSTHCNWVQPGLIRNDGALKAARVPIRASALVRPESVRPGGPRLCLHPAIALSSGAGLQNRGFLLICRENPTSGE